MYYLFQILQNTRIGFLFLVIYIYSTEKMASNKKPQIIDLSKLNLEQLTGLKNQLDQVSTG